MQRYHILVVLGTYLSTATCRLVLSPSFIPNCSRKLDGARTSRLWLASSSSSFGTPRRSLTASERAKREEEKSRRERAGDVVIGKTSAQPGAVDYAVDPTATEEEYLRQASEVEREVFRQTEKGLVALKLLQIDEATEAFNRVFQLRPNAYLWQAGIAKFYQDDLEGAADIFARSAAAYESRFGGPASEERIWRHACELKLLNSMSRKDRKLVEETGGVQLLLTPIPEKENTAELLRSESRKVIRITRDLFEASVEKDYSGIILSRAKLRSIGGNLGGRPFLDRKMWKLNSWYYLGLHYDAIGEYEESKRCMKRAILCSSGNGSDVIHSLPLLHMAQRDWFDDEEFDAESFTEQTQKTKPSNQIANPSTQSAVTKEEVDPIVVASIESSIEMLRLADLQDALKVRGIRSSGSKEELQQRLFASLMKDAGLINTGAH